MDIKTKAFNAAKGGGKENERQGKGRKGKGQEEEGDGGGNARPSQVYPLNSL